MTKSSVLEMPAITANRAAEMFAQPIMASIRMATYEFAFRGLSGIMLDRMTNELVKGLITGQKVDYPKDEPLELKALRKMYSDKYKDDMPDGFYGFPAENLYAALRDAGERVQYGSGKNDRVTMSTKGTELYNMIRLHEKFFPILGLDGKPAQWVIDLRKGNATQGNGATCFPRLQAHRLLERMLVAHAPTDLPLTPEQDFTPPEPPAVNGLQRGEGIVERWYDARNMGCIITTNGPARVHWSEVPPRPRRRFLIEGEKVRVTALDTPPPNPKTEWRKVRNSRFQLQACGVEVA